MPSPRPLFLLLLTFLLGLSLNPPSHRSPVQISVLWSTGLARAHIASFLPRGHNTTALNHALHTAIRADHAAFAVAHRSNPDTTSTDLNDAFFHHQTSRGPNGTAGPSTLPHRTIPEFRLISQAVSRVADAMLAPRDPPRKRRRLQGWATVHSGASSHEMHVHEGTAVACVYYVRVPPGAGGLRLYDPRGPRPPFDGHVELVPGEGEIVAFPGWLVHEVVRGDGDGERVSVAFNVIGGWDEVVEVSEVSVAVGEERGRWKMDFFGKL